MLNRIIFGMLLLFTLVFTLGASTVKAAVVNENLVSEEKDLVLSGGGISDGENIWVIPYEAGSFAKINMKTGEREDLSMYDSFDKLNSLEGYKAGVLYANEEVRFIYLAPYAPNKPLVKINIDTLDIEYPIKNAGFYYGAAEITSEEGSDYLWLFPSTIKPEGMLTETKIAKINISKNELEAMLPSRVKGQYHAYSDTAVVNNNIWLVTADTGGIIVLDTVKNKLSPLDLQKRLTKYGTAVFDGTYVWVTGEDISYSINESLLLKCEINGAVTETYKLTKDRYQASFLDDGALYLMAGTSLSKPCFVKVNTEDGQMAQVPLTERKGYVPAYGVKADGDIWVLPDTMDGVKMPIVKVTPSEFETIKTFTIVETADRSWALIAEIGTGKSGMLEMGEEDIESLYEQISAIKESIDEKMEDNAYYQPDPYAGLLLEDGNGVLMESAVDYD